MRGTWRGTWIIGLLGVAIGLFLAGSASAVPTSLTDTQVSVTSAGEGPSFGAGDVVRGILTRRGSVSFLLLDLGNGSLESFDTWLRAIPSSMTVRVVDLQSFRDWDGSLEVQQTGPTTVSVASVTTAGTPVPEPTAAVVFLCGLVALGSAVRRAR